MPEFTFVARKPDGSLFRGSLHANDRRGAIVQIEQQQGVPIKIDPAGAAQESRPAAKPSIPSAAAETAAAPVGTVQRLPIAQLFLFTEQLSHLLSAGMTLDEALGILVRRLQQPKLKAVSKSLHQGLVDGRSLSQAMRDFPKIFSPLYINMVSAGEASGALSQILRRLVAHIADIKALRDRVKQALLYPAALVFVGIALIIVFMTVMVPQLTKFLQTTGQKLPPATQLLIDANFLLTHYWWVGVVAGGGLLSLWKIGTRPAEGRRAWDRFLWHFPGFSRIPRYRFYAQFARTLATLSENGVTLLKSLELLEEMADNAFVRGQMIEVRKAVMDGSGLSNALRQAGLFPDLFLDMMAVGEQTGHFSETMGMVADVHERELDKQVQFVSTLVPLLVIIVIATLVGLMVYAILSAVFGLTAGLQGRMH
ncbi:MAG: type II secretion system F family protein [Verrucomicrobia bacterium]|nr:type II secretion system F family protein [Verrucomicrobiota bacterium]